jgi:hypothetical protein
MVALLLTIALNNGINDFTTHQTAPSGHPNLTTRGHIHKVINNHHSLTARALHVPSPPQKGLILTNRLIKKKA